MVAITSFEEPSISTVRLQLKEVEVVLDKKSFGFGMLYVSEGALCWEKNDKSVGFNLDYHNITLHATSRDQNLHTKECIYILTDSHVEMPGTVVDRTNNVRHNDGDCYPHNLEADVSELLLIPSDITFLESIYDSIKLCQELNPDPDDLDQFEDEMFADAEEIMEENSFVQNGDRNDHVIDNLANSMQNSRMNNEFNFENDEEEFEDAD